MYFFDTWSGTLMWQIIQVLHFQKEGQRRIERKEKKIWMILNKNYLLLVNWGNNSYFLAKILLSDRGNNLHFSAKGLLKGKIWVHHWSELQSGTRVEPNRMEAHNFQVIIPLRDNYTKNHNLSLFYRKSPHFLFMQN